MTLVDSPIVPLPAGLARRLMAWSIVWRSQAASLGDIGSGADSIYQLNEGNWQWKGLLDQQEAVLGPRVPAGDLVGVPQAAVLRGLLRQIHARVLSSYRFFGLMSRVHPGRYRFVLAAPRGLRRAFVERGLPIDLRWSALLWAACKCLLVAHAASVLLRRGIGMLLRTMGRPVANGRPILWLGLSAGELNFAPGEMNALDFARTGRYPLFGERLPLFVAAPWLAEPKRLDDVNAVLCADPVLEMSRGHFRAADVVRLVVDSCAVGARVLRDAFREDGMFLLLAREYAELPLMRAWFPRVRPRAVLMTNSMHSSHPLWIAYAAEHQCEVAMLFYATNVLPLYLRGGRDPFPGDPGYRLLECSKFEVWNESQKQWLLSLGIPESRINIAGIIVWGRDEQLAHRHDPSRVSGDRPFRLGLFDVVPPSVVGLLPHGAGDNYYSCERMMKLLRDVVETAAALPGQVPEVVVKPKRARIALHDGRYFDLLDDLVRAGQVKVGLLPTNPIEAVAACDMVISAPFSSPSVIAAEMRIPSCFYDPVSLLEAPPTFTGEVPLVSGQNQLQQWMRQWSRA